MDKNKLVKEIRIGNWIEGKAESSISEFKPYKVYAETYNDIESTYGYFRPIPLTEEWLIKFGFKYVDYVTAYCDKNHLIYKCKEEKWMFEPYCTNDSDCWVEIQYVHQLQNLYFALTGEELQAQAGGV